jgi:hypothetical protein
MPEKGSETETEQLARASRRPMRSPTKLNAIEMVPTEQNVLRSNVSESRSPSNDLPDREAQAAWLYAAVVKNEPTVEGTWRELENGTRTLAAKPGKAARENSDVVVSASGRRIRALSIRQPWAELIMLGRKKIEYRSRQTHIRERVYIYAGEGRSPQEDEAQFAREYRLDLGGGTMGGRLKCWGWLVLMLAAGCARVQVHVRREALETIAATAIAAFAAGSTGDQPHACAGTR